MNPHLSLQQISKWMMGERTPAQEKHVRECPECSAEVVRLEAALTQFRASVRLWADRESSEHPARPGFRWRPARWAWVAAILLMVAAIPIYRDVRDRERKAEMAKADAALLEQVDAGVSRAIAAPMEPLARLMAWDDSRNGDIR